MELHTNLKSLYGWGRTAPSTAHVLSTPDVEVIKQAVAQVAQDNESLPEPVSYTHLTLPTIHVECRSRWSPYH